MNPVRMQGRLRANPVPRRHIDAPVRIWLERYVRPSKNVFRKGVVLVENVAHQRPLTPPFGTIVDDELVVEESFPAMV